MMTREPHRTNDRQAAKIRTLVEELLATITRPGFYGEGGIVVTVQDGVLQHVRSKIEQLTK